MRETNLLRQGVHPRRHHQTLKQSRGTPEQGTLSFGSSVMSPVAVPPLQPALAFAAAVARPCTAAAPVKTPRSSLEAAFFHGPQFPEERGKISQPRAAGPECGLHERDGRVTHQPSIAKLHRERRERSVEMRGPHLLAPRDSTFGFVNLKPRAQSIHISKVERV